ncbi:hypothetical protein BDW66DRAFT_5154 [Aspergillus desertorum]
MERNVIFLSLLKHPTPTYSRIPLYIEGVDSPRSQWASYSKWWAFSSYPRNPAPCACGSITLALSPRKLRSLPGPYPTRSPQITRNRPAGEKAFSANPPCLGTASNIDPISWWGDANGDTLHLRIYERSTTFAVSSRLLPTTSESEFAAYRPIC